MLFYIFCYVYTLVYDLHTLGYNYIKLYNSHFKHECIDAV